MMKKILSLTIALSMLFSVSVAAEDVCIVETGSVAVLVNGEEITNQSVEVAPGTEVVLVPGRDDVVAVGTQNGYYPVNTPIAIESDVSFADGVEYTLGITMVEGAQVRVGTSSLDETGKLDARADSGIRFIALADYADTVINDESVEFGIKVVAENSDSAAYIKAEKFQNDDNRVFSAAIKNLSPSNYNRKYTAMGYALVTMANGDVVEFNSESVTRSVYQVSVGIMKNSSAEAEDNVPYNIDEAVKNVLNAYINQTGIRLSYNSSGEMSARTSGSGAYSGDVFFSVESTVLEDGGTRVVITPLDKTVDFANSVTIASWWKEYIRVNNNNTKAVAYIYNGSIENGVLSFVFKVPTYTFNQDDSVMIVSEIDEESIKGYKAGVLEEYELTDCVDVMGLSSDIEAVVPGSVVLLGMEENGACGAIELLATIGMPVDKRVFAANYGVYNPSDGTEKYKNIVGKMYSKSGASVTTVIDSEGTKVKYTFASSKTKCYRVGIAMDGDVPVISYREGAVIGSDIFGNTTEYTNYVYFRYNNETAKITQAVIYAVSEKLDFSGDGEYSDIFSWGRRIIIE